MNSVVAIVQNAMGSPWLYLAIFVFVTVDAFFPTIPGETLVVTSGVFAASAQDPNVLAVIAVAALAGLAGDHVSYTLGRTAGSRLLERLEPGSRKRRPFDWARTALQERGGVVLIVCRFIPGSRTATTLTTGALRFPLRTFGFYTCIGSVLWSAYFTLVGYVGGLAFQRHPLVGVLLGIAAAVSVTSVFEGSRFLLRRRSVARSPHGPSTNGEQLFPTPGND